MSGLPVTACLATQYCRDKSLYCSFLKCLSSYAASAETSSEQSVPLTGMFSLLAILIRGKSFGEMYSIKTKQILDFIFLLKKWKYNRCSIALVGLKYEEMNVITVWNFKANVISKYQNKSCN